MTPRERILNALSHKEPDRIPLDIGGTITTTINRLGYENLLSYLGFEEEISVLSQRSQVVIPSDEFLKQCNIGTRTANLPQSPETPPTFKDSWGVTHKYSKASHLYIAYKGPFQDLKNPVPADLKEYSWPDPKVIGHVSNDMLRKARGLHEKGYAVIFSFLHPLLGVVHISQFMRGYDKWLMDLHLHRDFVVALADKITEIWIESAKNILKSLDEYIDIVWWGDDLGTQQGPLFNPELYRKLIKPRHKKINEAIKSVSDARILFHSDGDIHHFIPDFIEIGVDALNPIQPTNPNMEPAKIKQDYGRDLALWGTIDTQETLPTGTPEEVKKEVQQRIEKCASNGGFVISAVHNIQSEVPPKNIIAMVEAVHQYGKY